jgi:hypothetical protein
MAGLNRHVRADWLPERPSADHAALNGVDRSSGGVHLVGTPAWRWAEEDR